MVSKYHSKLHPNTLEALMCARSWLGNNMKGSHLELIFMYERVILHSFFFNNY